MKKIGKFTIAGMLGKGGMGKVLKVTYPVTGKVAALKLLSPTPLLDRIVGRKRLEKIFTQEAVTLAQIRHPNVVEILDFDYHQGRPFYLMDFHSNNLAHLIGEGHGTESSRPMGIHRTVHYMAQALQGLACLHFAGIIHRDMKPANLLLTQSDQVKICDFGLSKLRGETLTHQDQVRIGSPYYAAPEQEADPDRVDERADLYSMGVMLFRLLTGELPGTTDKTAGALNPDLGPAWDAFFARAMATAPANRFQTAREMEAALCRLGRDWEDQKELTCAAPALLEPALLQPESPPARPLEPPRKIPRSMARDLLDLDPLMRPNHFWPRDQISVDATQVFSPATGLIWEKGGTPFPLNWADARAHVQTLNLTTPGPTPWRLPTLAELLTLARPLPRGEAHCLAPIWNPTQKSLWSADRCTFSSAWYLNLDMGFANANDLSSFYYAKAVRSPSPKELAAFMDRGWATAAPFRYTALKKSL